MNEKKKIESIEQKLKDLKCCGNCLFFCKIIDSEDYSEYFFEEICTNKKRKNIVTIVTESYQLCDKWEHDKCDEESRLIY